MEFYRCRICGETYLGAEPPSRCPFCGVTADLFVLTQEFDEDSNQVHVTELERADLETAIGLERDNARFYRALSLQRENLKLASAYKRLANVEAEHCSLFCKLAGISKPADLLEPSEAPEDWCANIAESLAREQKASAFYAEAAARATSERIAEVLTAISAVERDHIQLDGVAARIANCR
jgi:rubrerythrin